MQQKSTTVADVILDQLFLWKIKNIYGVAGDAIIPLLEGIGNQNKLNYFAVRHETAAAFMASAEGKCSGNIGVCVGTSGPGLVNMLNGIADAAADHIPMLVITGQVESSKVGTEAKQYIEQQQMIAPLAVYTTSLLHPDAVVTVMNKAIIEALTKRGVAHVSIPKDVLSLPCIHEPKQPMGILENTKLENLSHLDKSVVRLESAKKPMIYMGIGGRGAAQSIMRLADKLKAGIIETLGAKGAVPSAFPLNVGGIGVGGTQESSDLLKESDCILMIGANWYPEGFVPNHTNVIKIDIWPASIESQKDISIGLVGMADDVVNLITERIVNASREDWLLKIKQTKEHIIKKQEQERKSNGSQISPALLIASLEEHIDEDAIISLDTGDHTIWFNRIFRAKQQKVLFSGKWRTMGFGLPAAISAKIQHADKQVVAIVGDGSFAMTMMELSSVIKYNIPLKIIVANNSTLAAEKSKMKMAGLEPFGVDLVNPNFAQLASSYGIKSIRIEKDDELNSGLKEAFSVSKPVLVEVLITDLEPPLVKP